MRVALAVNEVVGNPAADLACIEALALQAGRAGAELVVFPETAATGLINNDDPEHDLPLGRSVPGPMTDAWAGLARRHALYFGIGLHEREGGRLYDSAVLLSPWQPRAQAPPPSARLARGGADPATYALGEGVLAATTEFGRVCFLICGDLFDDSIVAQVRACPGLFPYPFARNFGDGTWDQARWDREELPEYAARAPLAGGTTLMTNLLLSHAVSEYACFGGAWVVSAGGEVLHAKPLGERGILLADV